MGWRKIVAICVSVLAILVAILKIGYEWGQRQTATAEPIAIEEENEDKFDLQLPGEVEKRVITAREIKLRLVEIGQLATYLGEYVVEEDVEQARYMLDDIKIPGTTNFIHIKCEGIVKVGYDIDDIRPTVDNDSQKIYIALPLPTVLDNYIIWDSIECTEENSILNPIDFAQYKTLITELEEMGLEKAEADGIYEAAEQNLKTIIQNFLSGFEEYTIVFM